MEELPPQHFSSADSWCTQLSSSYGRNHTNVVYDWVINSEKEEKKRIKTKVKECFKSHHSHYIKKHNNNLYNCISTIVIKFPFASSLELFIIALSLSFHHFFFPGCHRKLIFHSLIFHRFPSDKIFTLHLTLKNILIHTQNKV